MLGVLIAVVASQYKDAKGHLREDSSLSSMGSSGTIEGDGQTFLGGPTVSLRRLSLLTRPVRLDLFPLVSVVNTSRFAKNQNSELPLHAVSGCVVLCPKESK